LKNIENRIKEVDQHPDEFWGEIDFEIYEGKDENEWR